jgi:hypothetical protein
VPPERVAVDSFYLADGAQVVGGKLYVLGGGWNYLNLGEPNAQVELFAIVGRILAPIRDSDGDLEFLIHLEHSDVLLGGPRFHIFLRPKNSPGQQQSIETATPFALDVFGLNFPRAGEYAFVLSHDGEELARTRFQVNFVGTRKAQAMGEMEDRGYIRLPHSAANFAFYKNENDGSEWLNLYWLADVIRHYQAGDAKLTEPIGETEFQRELNARAQLEILRQAVERVSAESESREL